MLKSHPPSTKIPTRSGGFTLVKPLVTITVIVVLSALSVASFMKFRGATDKAGSTGNLRQLQIADANYATDRNGSYVPGFAKG